MSAVPDLARAFWLRKPGAGEIRAVRLREVGERLVIEF